MSRILMALAKLWVGFWPVQKVLTREEFVSMMCEYCRREYEYDDNLPWELHYCEGFYRTSKAGFFATGDFYWQQMLFKWVVIYSHPNA